jgi:hypothetical protein
VFASCGAGASGRSYGGPAAPPARPDNSAPSESLEFARRRRRVPVKPLERRYRAVYVLERDRGPLEAEAPEPTDEARS